MYDLVFWRAASPIMMVLKLPALVVVSVLLGATGSYLTCIYEATRITGYLPYFVIAAALRNKGYLASINRIMYGEGYFSRPVIQLFGYVWLTMWLVIISQNYDQNFYVQGIFASPKPQNPVITKI